MKPISRREESVRHPAVARADESDDRVIRSGSNSSSDSGELTSAGIDDFDVQWLAKVGKRRSGKECSFRPLTLLRRPIGIHKEQDRVLRCERH